MLVDKLGRPILQYFDEKEKVFKVQPKISTVESIEESNGRIALKNVSSSDGVEILPGEDWISPVIETKGLNMFNVFTKLPSGSGEEVLYGDYEVNIERLLNDTAPYGTSGSVPLFEGTRNLNTEVSKMVRTPYARIRITNRSENKIKIATTVYLTRY